MTAPGGATMHAAWVQLCALGFVAATASRLWLAYVQAPARAAPAIAAASTGREAVLAETCDASDSGWARLVRAALAQTPPTFEGGYRDGAPVTPPPELVRVHESEKKRLGRGLGLGLVGALAMIASAIAMVRTGELGGLASFVGLVAGLFAWRIVVAAARSRAATETAWRGLDVLAPLAPPPPARVVDASGCPIRLTSGARFFGGSFLFISTVVLLVFFFGVTDVIGVVEVRTRLFAFVFFSPLFLATFLLLARKRIDVDVARGELTYTRRFLGVPYGRTRIPLEIVRGAVFRKGKGSRAADWLVIELTAPAAEVKLDGDGGVAIADRVNRIFEKKKRSS